VAISIRDEQPVKFHAGDIGFCQGREYRAAYGGRCAIVMVPRLTIERRARRGCATIRTASLPRRRDLSIT
jgi:hypothetical protein